VAGGQGVTWSDKYTIRSPLPTGSHNFTWPQDGWGEGGVWTAALAAREVMSTTPIRAVHHFGDLSYAFGATHIWDERFAMIQAFSTAVPLMISLGNHEYCYNESHAPGLDPSLPNATHGFMPIRGNMGRDSGGECGVPVAKRVTMPWSSSSNVVFWYAYSMGSVHTTVLSVEHDLAPGSPQHEWLEAGLAAADRSLTPWLVVEVHRPIYQAEAWWDQIAVGIGMRWEFEDLLYDYDVDLYLAGHYHSYLRTCDGLFLDKCNNGGPTHITVGTAGAMLTIDKYDLYQNRWLRKDYGRECQCVIF
jgi:hypothetical protein